MSRQSLTIHDHRTDQQYEFPVTDGCIRALDLRQIRVSKEDPGLISYDPGFKNTASCRSRITYIDGEKGVLRYCGYPIEQLAQTCTFLEVAFLLHHGELPSTEELAEWEENILSRRAIDPAVERLIECFPAQGNAVGMVMSAVSALSSLYAEAVQVDDAAVRSLQVYRLIAKLPTIAAAVHRHRAGLQPVASRRDLSYTENFLNMSFQNEDQRFTVEPVLARALDILFILHADHEQNCSANTIRSAGSSRCDPYAATAAAIAALSGPLHGGANEAVLRMLRQIGKVEQVPQYIERVKRGEFRLMGFGHRIYKNYDPRAKLIKKLADQVFEVTGSSPLLELALELEKIALEDPYFVERRLYPNVDFYSGLIYQAMGFDSPLFPVLFAVGRTAGWLAQWQEMLLDPEQKIARPLQIYQGQGKRELPDHKVSSAGGHEKTG